MLMDIISPIAISKKAKKELQNELQKTGYKGIPSRLSLQFNYFLMLKNILHQVVKNATNDRWSRELGKRYLYLSMLEDSLSVSAGDMKQNHFFEKYEEVILYYSWKIIFKTPQKFERFLRKIS